MPFYHRLGSLPQKRHTQFRKPNGELYAEELISTEGFSNILSLVYHCHPPTLVSNIEDPIDKRPKYVVENNLRHRSFLTFKTKPNPDFIESRVVLMGNNDLLVTAAAPSASMTDYYYKNADADEVIFIHKGNGTLRTMLGNIEFSYGDYLMIPRGMIYNLQFESEDNRLFIVESFHPVYTPKRYRNHFGQLLEHSPFCERDIRRPSDLETHDKKGEFLVKIKKEGVLYDYVYASHPFDVVGWDGYNYPYAFSIHDFEPITGRVHLPPPIHQTFETSAFVICSFCPRLYDYHPEAIPAPYNHSNIDSDEVLYYVDGDFMSRNDIGPGHISLHPAGIPHGPHPGAAERSIGEKETEELAVMVDTFKPLQLTKQALEIADDQYFKSWLD